MAQPGPPWFECRAIAHFRTCGKPLEGSALLRGTVVAVQKVPCSQILVLDVKRGSKPATPARIEIDLDGCTVWAGALRDVIDIAVREPKSDTVRYALACGRW